MLKINVKPFGTLNLNLYICNIKFLKRLLNGLHQKLAVRGLIEEVENRFKNLIKCFGGLDNLFYLCTVLKTLFEMRLNDWFNWLVKRTNQNVWKSRKKKYAKRSKIID